MKLGMAFANKCLMEEKIIMKSKNFEFFRDIWSELASLAGFAENHTQDEPRSALTKLHILQSYVCQRYTVSSVCQDHQWLHSWSY